MSDMNSIKSTLQIQMEQDANRAANKTKSPTANFGATLSAMTARGSSGSGASSVASAYAPSSSAVISAATQGGGGSSILSGGSGGGSGSSAVVAGGATAGASGGLSGAVAQRAANGDPAAQMMQASYQMQELNQVFNMQYLMLQQKMQGENRQYTALSNVMKSKHDTAKNALSNLK